MIDVGPVEFTVNCAVHGDETRVIPVHVICLECGHVFQTASDTEFDTLCTAPSPIRTFMTS